jgi:LPS sulfotransferase NodH
MGNRSGSGYFPHMGPRPIPDSYLVCATPRSGSTLLCGLLESSGVAGHPASYFDPRALQEHADRWGIDRPSDGRIDEAFMRAALIAGRTSNGVFGGRVMAETLPGLIADLAAVSGPGVSDLDLLTAQLGRLRFVHLRRIDVVAQAVSWARSLQTHFWHPGEAMAPGGEDPRYDEELIGELVAKIQTLEAGWATWFADQRIVPYEVTYEELALEPPGTASTVLSWLGLPVPQEHRLITTHQRQADHINEEWIRAYKSQ